MDILKQATSTTVVMGPMLDSTDGNTPETALTISQADIRLSKNGGAFAQSNNAAGATHMEFGNYSIPLDTTDTATLGKLRAAIHESGALAVWREFTVVPANVYDALVLGTDALQVDAIQLAGVVQSLTDLKDFADAGYDPATGKVVGVKLADTCTTNTDMVGTNGANTTTPPTVGEIKTEMEGAGTKLTLTLEDTADLQANQSAWTTATGFSTHSAADVKTAIEAAGSSIATILADTGELQTDWVNGGRLDLLLDAIPTTAMRGTDNAALASGVDLTKIHGVALTETIGGYLAAAFTKLFDVATPLLVASEVMRGTDSAYTGTPPTVTAIRQEMDSNSTKMAPSQVLADYKATGFNTVVPDAAGVAPTAAEIKTAIEAAGSSLALILADTGTNGVLIAPTATSAQLVDDVWDEILSGATHNIATSAGRRIREIGAFAINSGTAQAGNSHSITLAATASAVDGTYNRNLIILTDNTGIGQTRTVIDYNGTTKVAVIDRDWRTNPDATTTYQITPANTPLVVDQGVAQAGTATTITLRAYASSINDTYLCNVVAIIAGTGRGQARLVGGYVGATKVVTICGDNWVTNPDTTSVYVMMPYGTTCTSCIGTHALTDIAEAVHDDVIEGSLTSRHIQRIILAASAGKITGGGTDTIICRDDADSKARITATVDTNGNRTAVTKDGT